MVDGKPELTFPNARYWSNQDHWSWAANPNPREKASFLKENLMPIQHSGNLNHISIQDPSPLENLEVSFFDGHTEKQRIPKIKYGEKTIVFMADLLPSIGHIPLPYVMGYDVRPLVTLEEKAAFLSEAADQNYYLFLEHDPLNEVCTVKHTEKGIRLDKTFRLSEIP